MTLTLRATTPDPHPRTLAPTSRPPWAERAGLAGLLVATGLLYLWNLSASGWANAYYSAAAQAGTRSWTAWFFGSSDAANAITVDKTPAALWITGLSVRIFGLSSWSVLVPQALLGVATVGLLYATVRRTSGTAAGLLAGGALALTPVAVLMFRFNNPDALLTLLLVGAAYATLRAVEGGRARWLVLAATLVGFGFLTKMLQAYLVLPALVAVWLLAAPLGLGRRLRGLGSAAVALVVSSGWWVLVVELWPAARRPFIGGSQNNSVLELVFGYNGLGRLTGDEVGSVGGGAGGAGGGWGETGLTRLFDAELGGSASWLLPAALLMLAALVWWTRRAPRTDPLRAAAVLWGGWLLITAAVFSLMAGIFHGYYLVALAPAIAALVGVGAVTLWRDRDRAAARCWLAGTVAVTAGWAFVLLRRTPTWLPWLSWAILGAGALAVIGLLVAVRRRGAQPAVEGPFLPAGPPVPGRTARRIGMIAVATAALLAGLAGPAAYAVATAATPHTGAIPSAGPEVAGVRGGQGGRGGPGGPGGFVPRGGGTGTTDGTGATDGTAAGNAPGAAGGPAGRTGGGLGGPGGGPTGGRNGGMGGATGGGVLGSPTPGAKVVATLTRDAASYTWAAAAVGSNAAAGYQLAGGFPVLAIGGFNGTDPAPTLPEFQQLVAAGRVHWFVEGAGRGLLGDTSSGGSDQSRLITDWVTATFTPTTVDGITLYDLSAPR